MLTSVLGLGLSCFPVARKFGIRLCLTALILYVLFGSGPVSFFLLGHLEYRIPPATPSERNGIHAVVVLAGYAEDDEAIPLSSRVNNASAIRILEAVTLYRAAPASTIFVSGEGAVPRVIGDVLVAVGIPPDRVQIDAASFSTAESARHLLSFVGSSPFLLVTSAGHMPRAVKVFEKLGMSPRPVPTHYMTRRNWLAIQYLPSPVSLSYSDLAISEYAALLWYRVRGWL
jgi:uncharacterized SAM-binding protein YcdF (DUF218 family)